MLTLLGLPSIIWEYYIIIITSYCDYHIIDIILPRLSYYHYQRQIRLAVSHFQYHLTPYHKQSLVHTILHNILHHLFSLSYINSITIPNNLISRLSRVVPRFYILFNSFETLANFSVDLRRSARKHMVNLKPYLKSETEKEPQ